MASTASSKSKYRPFSRSALSMLGLRRQLAAGLRGRKARERVAKRISVSSIFKFLKDYWFAITLMVSALASSYYLVAFDVSPLDSYHDIQQRRGQVKFHESVGFAHLENGNYARAKAEFQHALTLNPIDPIALNGRYLSDLFLELQSPGWDPAIGPVVLDRVKTLRGLERQDLMHITEKYNGDVQRSIGNYAEAQDHWLNALRRKPGYMDALYTYGWFNYGLRPPNIERMEQSFRKMTAENVYDYRGFHGLGYALYMRAIRERDPRSELILEAALQSEKASRLGIYHLNILMDFGEVARTVDPSLSLHYRRVGRQFIELPEVNALPTNKGIYRAALLLNPGEQVLIRSVDEKRAWLTYQESVDHLALARKTPENLNLRSEYLRQHDQLLLEAKKLDPKATVLPVYEDQRGILDILLPDLSSDHGIGRRSPGPAVPSENR